MHRPVSLSRSWAEINPLASDYTASSLSTLHVEHIMYTSLSILNDQLNRIPNWIRIDGKPAFRWWENGTWLPADSFPGSYMLHCLVSIYSKDLLRAGKPISAQQSPFKPRRTFSHRTPSYHSHLRSVIIEDLLQRSLSNLF